MIKIIRAGGLATLMAALCACVAQVPSGDAVVGVGCTEAFVTYKKDLERLIEEGQDEAAQERLEKIIKYVECEEEEGASQENK